MFEITYDTILSYVLSNQRYGINCEISEYGNKTIYKKIDCVYDVSYVLLNVLKDKYTFEEDLVYIHLSLIHI